MQDGDPEHQDEYLYDAFISYRRSDGTSVATWLRRRLQDYRLPPSLSATHKKLHVYLDTAFERANEDFWTNNIEPALKSSRTLIVIATPDTLRRQATGQPNWVEREIDTFLNLPQKTNIVVARAKGDFDAELPAHLLERFPRITIVDLRHFSSWRDHFYLRQSLRTRLLTILGAVHNIQPEQVPELRMEDARNARNAAMRLAAVAAALLVVISALAVTAFIQRNSARAERNIAETNAAQAQARELAAYADGSLNQDPERSLILAIEAVNTTLRRNEPPVTSAENALQHAVFASLSRATLQGHAGHVNAIALSPDGTRAATGGADNTARIWDLTTGATLLTIKDFAGPVNALSFSPDGRRLVTASQVTLGFTPDGQFTKTGRPEETVSIWDAGTGKRILILQGSLDRVNALALSADGRFLATANGDKTQLWNALTGQERLTFAGHGSPAKALIPGNVEALSFGHDSRYLATANADRTATIWDTSTGRELLTVRDGVLGIESVALSPDGKLLATAADNVAKLWDTSTGRERTSLKGHESTIDAIAFSPDGRFLVTGSWDKTARIWDLVTTWSELATMRGHTDFVAGVVFSTDGRRVATASWDGTAKIWDAVSGPELVTLKDTYDAAASDFSPDGTRLAISSDSNSAKVWDIARGKELVTMRGHADHITAIAFSPNGKYLATGSADHTAKVWDAANGTELATLRPTSTTIGVLAVAMSPDGQHLATGTGGGEMTIFDWNDGHELFKRHGHDSLVTSLAFSPDGTRLASGGFDRTVKIWDASNGSELRTLRGYTKSITKVVFSSDGKWLATTSQDGLVRVWDAESGGERMTVRGHQESANDVVFSPDGTRIASASTDGTVKIWEAGSGQELLTLHSYLAPLYRVTFQRDGRHLAASAFDKVQTYTLDIQELLKIALNRIGRRPPVLTPQECRQYFPSPSQPCPLANESPRLDNEH
ncbi:MAG: TIR domain-containing protein [Nitrospira sp.]|nr:TIR domain-containing protein [Nitrospira sp.]